MEIVVIGGGAAGLMAAVFAAANGAKVRLLERNDRIGKKILVTGNGKCNLGNEEKNLSRYHTHAPQKLAEVFSQFSFEDARQFFEQLGIVYKSRGGWLYPYSEQAQSVVSALEREARRRNVTIKTREEVTSVQKQESGFTVYTKTWQYPANAVIVTTGGPASSVEGSGEEGMHLLEGLGHRLYPPTPALVPLKIAEKKLCIWSGTRMEAAASLWIDGIHKRTETGEIQFTDYGISGIAVFQLSIEALQALLAQHTVQIRLDLVPGMSEEELVHMLADRQMHLKTEKAEELFNGFLPDRMIRALSGKKKRTAADWARLLKQLTVTITGSLSMERAQVADGGISLDEIDPHTMQSVHVPGLYMAGEVLDVCAECGGYNLQWAWSGGALAGRSAATSV